MLINIIIVTVIVVHHILYALPSFDIHDCLLTRFHTHYTTITTTTRYVRIEKIPGGELSDCCVIDGVMFNKGKYEYVHGHGHAYESV